MPCQSLPLILNLIAMPLIFQRTGLLLVKTFYFVSRARICVRVCLVCSNRGRMNQWRWSWRGDQHSFSIIMGGGAACARARVRPSIWSHRNSICFSIFFALVSCRRAAGMAGGSPTRLLVPLPCFRPSSTLPPTHSSVLYSAIILNGFVLTELVAERRQRRSSTS